MAKLRPRARIIRTIGDQLISGPEAAVIELVKNAYDADADSVLVKFLPPGTDGPRGGIQICDNGHGMTHDDVVTRWFEPATDEKLRRRFSPSGRRLLGAKGIGRFAVSRLGLITLMRTWARVGNCVEQSVVEVDWEQFDADRFLDSIEIPTAHTRLTQASVRPGTEITITRLRDTWSKGRLERLIRELRRVASPSLTDSHFQIRLDLSELTKGNSGFDGEQLLAELNIDPSSTDSAPADPTLIVPFQINDHADYTLKGSFDSDGSFLGTFTNHRGDGTPQPLQLAARPIQDGEEPCGPITLHLNIYDREAEAVEALFRRMGLNFEEIGIRAARRIISENSGIAIFRSGFRIRPYGEPENDWLELESQRVQNPSKKLGISQLSGEVTVASEETSLLVERSSREGLEHNGAFVRLKELIQSVLNHAEERRLAFRERAGLSRRVSGDVAATKTLASLPAIRKAAERAPAPFRSELERAVEKDSTALAASLEELDAYQKLLQSRAALGLVVAQVIHEARRILNPLAEAARTLSEDAELLTQESKLGAIARRHLPHHLDAITSGTRELSRLVKRLDPISGRRRGSPRIFSISDVVNRSLMLFSEAIAERNVQVDVSHIDHLEAYGYAEDLQSALMNILENALHWVGTQESGNRFIRISAIASRSTIQLRVSNSGPGIDPSYIPRLFQAGFSLKSNGTGLGLAIAREACRASKGDLSYDEGADDTTFVITLRKSNRG